MNSEIEANKLALYNTRKVSNQSIWLTFLLLGWSYGSLGKMGLQIAFYLTFGGFGIWWFIQLFTLNAMVNEYNRNIARKVGITDDCHHLLGL